MIKFSIITVCLNTEDVIGSTIASVLEQNYADFEYIIKDGLSTDHTMGICRSFSSEFEKRNIPFHVYSRKDQGIYDAMNQAVEEAKGDWVVFMNAGDRFAQESTLKLIAQSGYMDTADIIYGDTIRKKEDLYLYTKSLDLQRLRYEMPFCHQSTYMRRTLLMENPYSTRYRICSDYKFCLDMYQQGKKFAYIPQALSIYDTLGASSDSRMSYADRIKMLEDMPNRDEEAIQKVKKAAKQARRKKYFVEHIWKKCVPETIRLKRREKLDRKAGWKTAEEFFGTDSGFSGDRSK